MSQNQQYLSTNDLCERFQCSDRTIQRLMLRQVRPLPRPALCLRKNLWHINDIAKWQESEREANQEELK